MKFIVIAPLSLAGVVSSLACGPLFNDTLLDRPAAVLGVPVNPFTEQLLAIPFPEGMAAGLHEHPLSAQAWRTPNHPLSGSEVVAVEVAELNRWWDSQGMADERRQELVTSYRKWRDQLAEGIDVGAAWGNAGPPDRSDVGPFAYASQLPDDVRRYLEGVRAFRLGRVPAARGIWRALLERPPEDRPRRTLWAAWMLAKTEAQGAEAMAGYRHVLDLAADPRYADPLRLAAASAGWLGRNEGDPILRLRWYVAASRAGQPHLIVSVRSLAASLLDPKQPDLMARAAADPLARQLVTAHLASSADQSDPRPSETPAAEDVAGLWLAALEAQRDPLPNAITAAWICYSRAEFDRAARWLKHAPSGHPDTLWLRAKLAFRNGQTAQAVALLKQAATQIRPPSSSKPGIIDEVPWFDGGSRQDYRLGQLHAELGIGLLAEGEIVRGLEMIERSGYAEDAYYVGERLLSADELKNWVLKRYPDWSPEHQSDGVMAGGDRWRYLLARRLTRELRLDEARPFMPTDMLGHFDRYAALHRAGRDETLPPKTRSAVLWAEACLMREHGMELVGTEGSPDHSAWDGAFELTGPGDLRTQAGIWPQMADLGWNEDLQALSHRAQFTVPLISREERDRYRRYAPQPERRFHYRYVASELGWQAARLLPDDDPSQAYMHNQAGRWLALRDPGAADRHYQALVDRNPHLLEGLEADRRRWFLPDLAAPDCLPKLPPSLAAHEAP